MSQLTDEQLSILRERLDAEQRALESVIHEHVARLQDSSTPDMAQPAGDIADLAEVELVREHENTAVGRDVRGLREIEAARARLADGSAGTCIDCGSEIGFDRLMVQPTASRCVPCQELHEQAYQPVADLAAEAGGRSGA